MTEELKKTIKEELANLTQEGQDAINAVDWVKITEEIGKKFNLEESEVGDLQIETLLVLIGATDLEFYAVNIENHVNTTTATANALAEEVFKQVLTPVRNLFEENIKKSVGNKNLGPEQNLNFILSGGNYSSLMKKNYE